jgi:peptide/nickel transport system permease protein
MLLYGARETLVVAVTATAVRLALGLVLGAVAGWWPGSLWDRAVTLVIECLATVPGLILAVLLLSVSGSRYGRMLLITALSMIGWQDITRLVRGYVLAIRGSARPRDAGAVEFGWARVLGPRVLSALPATLLVVSALEMGSVLLLLGELSFVHVFVSDGSVQAGGDSLAHSFDVPDWGTMLGTSWRYFRSRPWVPVAPAVALFVTTFGFNLFGHGVQRLAEEGQFRPSRRSLCCALAVAALLVLSVRVFLASTSVEAQLADLARRFDEPRVQRIGGDAVYFIQPETQVDPFDLACRFDVRRGRSDTWRRAQPEIEERPIAPGGSSHAAGYIAYQFEQAGLKPPPKDDYFQHYVATRGRITAGPALEILGPDGEPRVRLDDGVSFDPLQPFETEGISREDELVVLGNARHTVLPGQVLLLLDPTQRLRQSWGYRAPPGTAVLRLVPDDELSRDGQPPGAGPSDYVLPFPNLLVGESAARQLLAEAGQDLDKLRAALQAGERIELHTGLRVRVQAGLTYEEVATANVIGYLPAADGATQGERVLVTAAYGGPASWQGRVCARSDGHASGVAVMLEVARLWRDMGFQPRRTVVFAAFDVGGGEYFVHHPVLPISTSDTWTAVTLQRLGTGGSHLARQEAGEGLARIFDRSARRFGVRTEELEGWTFFFTGGSERLGSVRADASYTGLAVVRPGADTGNTPVPSNAPQTRSCAVSGEPADLDQGLLAAAGQTVAHYLMVLSSR